MKELEIDAKPENLGFVFSFVKGELEKCGCPPRTERQIRLCVEEIFMNISSYAYHPETGPATILVDVLCDSEPSQVVISFQDSGRPFDPLAESEPDLGLDVDERPIGGLGIFLVRSTMDDVGYEYRNGRNILTMQKDFAVM